MSVYMLINTDHREYEGIKAFTSEHAALEYYVRNYVCDDAIEEYLDILRQNPKAIWKVVWSDEYTTVVTAPLVSSEGE